MTILTLLFTKPSIALTNLNKSFELEGNCSNLSPRSLNGYQECEASNEQRILYGSIFSMKLNDSSDSDLSSESDNDYFWPKFKIALIYYRPIFLYMYLQISWTAVEFTIQILLTISPMIFFYQGFYYPKTYEWEQ